MQIEIDDQLIANNLDDFCAGAGYQEQISDNLGGWLPNPETKDSFFSRTIQENAQNFITSNIQQSLNNKALKAVVVPSVNVTIATPVTVLPAQPTQVVI